VGETLLLSVGALVAATVSGATGFGFALVATALWSQLLEPRVVTTLALVYMLALNLGYLPFFWREIPWRRLAPYAVGGVLGVPLGAWALDVLPASALRPAVGALLLAYSAWMLARVHPPALVLSPRAGQLGDAGIGLIGGFLGGLAGLSGFLPTLWCALRGGDRKSNRALVQAYILLTGVLGIAWVGGLVGIDAPVRERLWFGAPFVIAGGALGLFVFSRLDAARFNRLVLWLLALCGAILLVHGR
jgi:uncharacterized membrane protein YfcA